MYRTICGILLLCLPLAACYATQQARGAKPTGFLSDLGQLREGEGDEAQLVYVNPHVDFSRYTNLLMEPVTIWTAPGSKLESAPRAELQILADALGWLTQDDRAETPWFAWVHLFDVHHPYEAPEEVAAKFPGRPYIDVAGR